MNTAQPSTMRRATYSNYKLETSFNRPLNSGYAVIKGPKLVGLIAQKQWRNAA